MSEPTEESAEVVDALRALLHEIEGSRIKDELGGGTVPLTEHYSFKGLRYAFDRAQTALDMTEDPATPRLGDDAVTASMREELTERRRRTTAADTVLRNRDENLKAARARRVRGTI